MPRESRLISLKEAASYLSIHPSTLYRMLKRGEIQAIKVGSEWIDAHPPGKVGKR
jgi:excisionase family DNA binding protein